jgi:hypothetical protein
MKKDNNKEILLLPAPKSPLTPTAANTANTADGGGEFDNRKYGENTVRDSETGRFVTGNPGKPVGARHFSSMFKRVIKQMGGVAKDGQKVSYDEIIVKKIVLMASDGNLKAAEIVIERVDGKVKQEHEISGDFGKVILPKEDVERIDVMWEVWPKTVRR